MDTIQLVKISENSVLWFVFYDFLLIIVGPCHHSMLCPQVADGKYNL